MRASSTIRNAALLRDRGLCCNCGVKADHTHHVVPLGRGGQDVLSNVVSLCSGCHDLAHGTDWAQLSAERARASLAHRKATGGNLGGRKVSYTPAQIELGLRLRAEGQSIGQIARALKLSKGTTHRMLQAAAVTA